MTMSHYDTFLPPQTTILEATKTIYIWESKTNPLQEPPSAFQNVKNGVCATPPRKLKNIIKHISALEILCFPV